VLVIFAIGLFIRYLSFVHEIILAAMRAVRVNLVIAVAAAFLNIVLNYLLIPPYGMDGAIAASAISLIFVTVLLVHFCKRVSGFGFPREAMLPIAGGVFTLLILIILRAPAVWLINSIPPISISGQPIIDLVLQKLVKLGILGILFCIACVSYFASLSALKAFGKEDIAVASGFLKKAKFPDGAVSFAEGMMGLKRD